MGMSFDEPLDLSQLTEEARQQGISTRTELCLLLERSILQDQLYLARRHRRGTHTPTDDMMAEVALCKALAICVLRGEIELP